MLAPFLRKLHIYAGAALARRSFNAEGCPLIPKSLAGDVPYSRETFNSFVTWITDVLHLREATCIFDVGANHGDFARAASACFPGATVWLFEPLPALHPLLEAQAARREGRWKVQPLALGDQAGTFPFRIDEADDNVGSLLGSGTATCALEVAVTTLDAFCQREKIDRIDLLKVDVEGFEFEVLAGAAAMLPRVEVILIEVSLRRGGTPLLRMIELLERNGLQVVGVMPMSDDRSAEPWRALEYNVLARRSRSSSELYEVPPGS